MTTHFRSSRARKGQLVTTGMTEHHTSPITADLSSTDLTITAPAIAAFWTDSQTHDRQTMRSRWVEGRYPDMPRELTGPIVDGAEALRRDAA